MPFRLFERKRPPGSPLQRSEEVWGSSLSHRWGSQVPSTGESTTESSFLSNATPPSSKSPIRSTALSDSKPDQYAGYYKNSADTIAFEDSTISVAVDVSTSTTGLTLSQESLAIATICHHLSKDARKKGCVLPWSGTAHSIVQLKDSGILRPSYGTDPSVICSNLAHVTALKKSNIWFLMTDGMIAENDIMGFAEGIAENSLHGTTCVIIIFGDLPHYPMDLDTSVGVSIFAVAPNCLFLFHDINSGNIYVLQHKGCFTTTFAGVWSDNPILDYTATWDDLPQTTYEQLATLLVPRPINLRKDDIALAGNQIINLNDLYRGRVNPRIVSQIFSNDDNMKTVLLTAATRGKGAEVEAWLAKQKLNDQNQLATPRPDIGNRAFSQCKELIILMKTNPGHSDKKAMQIRLQKTHDTNWESFRKSNEYRRAETEAHNLVVRDSVERVRSISSGALRSPSSMSTVSSSPSVSRSRPYSNLSHSQPYRGIEHDARPYQTNRALSPPQYFYTPHYRRNIMDEYNTEPHGDCHLCNAKSTPLALLLKRPDPGLQTEGLPPPYSRAKLAYPLAMGNFPETDIVSTFICCDPCSYFVTQIGEAPSNEKIVSAIVLTNFEANQHLWKSALYKALEGRFAEEDMELLFLAILHTTLLDIDSDPGEANLVARRALCWVIDRLQQRAQIPTCLSQSLATPGESASHSQFFTVLGNSFVGVRMPKPPILRYPIEGFAILVRGAQCVGYLDQKLVDRAVCERFLFHLLEQFVAFEAASKASGVDSVNQLDEGALLAKLVLVPAKPQTQNEGELHAEDLSTLTVSSLSKGPLLTEEALETFQTMEPSFSKIEESGGRNLGKFVRNMMKMRGDIKDPVETFEVFRKDLDLEPMS